MLAYVVRTASSRPATTAIQSAAAVHQPGSQKQHVSLYHMGSTTGPARLAQIRVPKHTDAKLEVGKCCLRLKKLDQIPYPLIGELAGRMTPSDWIVAYVSATGAR